MGAMAFGMIYLKMISPSWQPMARAASMNSWSFTVSTEARTVLAKDGMWDMAMAMSTLTRLVPRAATMAVASSMEGIASRMSIARIITASTVFP